MMANEHNKPLMRCLGEFFGHIIQAIKPEKRMHELNRDTKKIVDGNVTLRRTTIDEIEIREEGNSNE